MSKNKKSFVFSIFSGFILTVAQNANAQEFLWIPGDADAESGAVSLAQYINYNPYGAIAKIAKISICFNRESNAADCKNPAKGVDQSIFSATLTYFDAATSTAQLHLHASRIFVFGKDNNSYTGDITVQGGFIIDGCTFALGGTPIITFANEENSTMPATYINVFHQQLTGQAGQVFGTFLGGYEQLPGFLSSCQ